ncbi:response regulator [Candidatus Sulfidibacterium hydrothermale]|uniref:response regulator n=1 Tax=Candidatus Sulfidibacterium hydrothermale TaxID=2875962 RepID=UPI001F0A0D77|nr:response regulator [Candidatus Sulfidibacterium hydrothermale]UBM61121.1 response regulator [Candidatus Sulfidibacterium hydrothermale]
MDYSRYQWPDKKILIADDDSLSRRYFAKVLEPTKATLSFVRNGKEAVAYCNDHPRIDLVLMDIKMPIKDGLTATRELKKNFPQIPVIVETAYAFDYDKINSLKSGADEYITKPILREKLFDMMEKYLNV